MRKTIACILAAGVLAACQRPAPHFSVDNARAHVGMLAGTIGVRPTGTDANRRAREYIVEQLRLYGYTVRVQAVDAVRPDLGLTARVANVIGVLPGRRAEAIGLVSHYDSEWTTPGAADAALGTAVVLETARVLAARPDRAHSVMVLLTDGEEQGLMGAAGLLVDPEVASRLRAYLNFEAVGNAGPAVVFETGPGNEWIVGAWASAAPEPRGASYHYEVYRRLPNDTDFSMLKRLGAPGLNMGAAGGSYVYHTPRDTPERLDSGLIRQMGVNAVATALALDARDLSHRTQAGAVFADVAGVRAWSVRPWVSTLWSALAGVLGLIAVHRAFVRARRTSSLGTLALTVCWTAAAFAAAAAAMLGAAWLLRAVREVYHPWYAHPWRFVALLVLGGTLAGWLVTRLAVRFPARLQPAPDPANAWCLTLLVWIPLAAAAEWFLPAAAYLWTLPLGAAALAVLLGGTGRAAPLFATLVLAVSATVWLPEAGAIVEIVHPILGRLPIVAPFFVMPALVLAVSVMVAPPLLILLLGTRRARAGETRTHAVWRRLRTPALAAAVAFAFAACYVAEAYTVERPLWRAAQFLQDDTGACAGTGGPRPAGCVVWEVAGSEPGLDVAIGGFGPTRWVRAEGPPLAHAPARRLPHPFTFRAAGSPQPVPGRATLRTSPEAGDLAAVEVAVAPDEPGLTAAFILPPGVQPVAPTLPGSVRQGSWTAVFTAVPEEGVTFRALLPRGPGGAPVPVRVALIREGLPGGEEPFRLPPWLGTERTVWAARSTWFVTPAPAGDAAAPLR